MIRGYFGEKGQLYFEIELIAANGEPVTVDALLDTGFTAALAMNIQDIASLGWPYVRKQEMQTARGEVRFNLYVGTVIFDGEEMTVPVLGGQEIAEILIGLPWLEDRQLTVNRKARILTLETAP